ncbi:MAG: aldo/keto reductase [Nesterenkonia sp.]|nr:aldo/keto reductase [Nesterenkonia sp.]
MSTLPLNSGTSIPQIGYGTYATEDTATMVAEALGLGYRHLDTAQMYGNEAGVGEGVRRSGVDRSEVFITTKLDNDVHRHDDALESFDRSLRALGTDYVDLFLIHWPLPTRYGGDFVSTWRTMLEIAESGRAKAVGVSNFEPEHVEALVRETGVVPAVNQIEVHPYFANDAVRSCCREHGIVVEAWSPLGRGDEFDDPTVREVADQLDASPAQVILRWHLQRGDVVIPKSSTRERMRENFDLHSFQLSEEQMSSITALDRGADGRRGAHPDTFTG